MAGCCRQGEIRPVIRKGDRKKSESEIKTTRDGRWKNRGGGGQR